VTIYHIKFQAEKVVHRIITERLWKAEPNASGVVIDIRVAVSPITLLAYCGANVSFQVRGQTYSYSLSSMKEIDDLRNIHMRALLTRGNK
jgi:hypothetical protein